MIDDTIALKLYGGRQGAGLFRRARGKVDLLQHCARNSHVWIQASHDDARLGKITSIRTWKRSPDRVEIHLKYGLYVYESYDLREACDRILIPIKRTR